MRNALKYIFIIFFSLLIFSTEAQEIDIDRAVSNASLQFQTKSENTNIKTNKKDAFIVNCAREKYTNNCSTSSVSSDKMINRNDLLFLGERLYLDNYNPLYFNTAPEILNNSIYVRAP